MVVCADVVARFCLVDEKMCAGATGGGDDELAISMCILRGVGGGVGEGECCPTRASHGVMHAGNQGRVCALPNPATGLVSVKGSGSWS
jgi:hypothetical protein